MLPDPSRRWFLALFGGLGAVVVANAKTNTIEKPSPGTVCPHHAIAFSGWREPMNQDVLIGFWSVSVPRNAYGDVLVSTVYGVVHRIFEGQVINLSKKNSWPWLTSRSSEREKNVAKNRALKALHEALSHATA